MGGSQSAYKAPRGDDKYTATFKRHFMQEINMRSVQIALNGPSVPLRTLFMPEYYALLCQVVYENPSFDDFARALNARFKAPGVGAINSIFMEVFEAFVEAARRFRDDLKGEIYIDSAQQDILTICALGMALSRIGRDEVHPKVKYYGDATVVARGAFFVGYVAAYEDQTGGALNAIIDETPKDSFLRVIDANLMVMWEMRPYYVHLLDKINNAIM